MRKVKIFVDAHVFDSSYQGTTTYLKGLYTALVNDERFEIHLGAHNTEHLKNIFTDLRFKFVSLQSTSKYKRLVSEIPKLIEKEGFDFAHFQYITPLFKKCRYINTIHDLLFLDFPDYFPFSYRFSKKYLFRFSALRSDVICTVSDYSMNALIKHFKIPAHKITITPNAVSVYEGAFTDVKTKYGISNYLLFVSRFEPRKNHYLMLKSYVDLRLYEQDYHLVFVGRLKDLKTKEYDSYYNSLPESVKNKVLYIENISDEELSSFYKYASLFVYPSVAEGFGIPPLEAAVQKCKVLCSNQTAMADFTFFSNYLFDPRNKGELEKKIIKTLNDSAYPAEEIKQAVIEKYNWDRIARHLADTLITSF